MTLIILLGLALQGDPEWAQWGDFGAGTRVLRKVTEEQGSLEKVERSETHTIKVWDGEVIELERAVENGTTEPKRLLRPSKLAGRDLNEEELTVGGKPYTCAVREDNFMHQKFRWMVQRATNAKIPVPDNAVRTIVEFRGDAGVRREVLEVTSFREGVELAVDDAKFACVIYEEQVTRLGLHEPRKRTRWWCKEAAVPGGLVREQETYVQGDFKWAWTITSTPAGKAKVGDREVATWKRVTVLEKTRPLVKGWKSREETVERLSREVPGWTVSMEKTVTGDEGESRWTEQTVAFEAKKN